MKKIISLLTVVLFSTFLLFTSCDVEPLDPAIDTSRSSTTSTNNTSGYAMTALINGVPFNANNPFGNNEYSTTNIWDYFPLADFTMLQGRQGGILGNPEINIWLKKSDIAVGTYGFVFNSYSTTPSHYIDLIDTLTLEYEDTISGSITITEVNSITKIVKGTFEFNCSDAPSVASPVINVRVTNGTFNYKYMN
jgi:hypothetical protein